MTSAPPRFSLADAQAFKSFYDENGFVIVKDAFDMKTLLDLKKEIAGVIGAYLAKADLPKFSGDDVFTAGIQTLEAKDHEYVAAVYDTIFQTPAFMRLISDRVLEKQIKLLLGVPEDAPLYGYTNRCRIDPPRDDRRTYDWHQEVFYTVPYGRYLQTWAPLVFDTTIANGTIEVCVGSHKEGIASKQSWTEAPGKATQIIVDKAITDKYKQIPVEMKMGEMLFFSGYLAHRSGSNTSGQVRYSLVGMYHDVRHPPFMTPKIGFAYRGKSPREFYNETFSPAGGNGS